MSVNNRAAAPIYDIQRTSQKISNIRYGKPGKIIFNLGEKEVTIAEPKDVLLIGDDTPSYKERAALWIATNYNFLLASLSGWNSDTNKAFFIQSNDIATIGKKVR